MDNATGDFRRDLRLLYAQAGRPNLGSVCSRVPVGFGLTAGGVHQWLNGGGVPSSLEQLTALIDELNAVMKRTGLPATHSRRHWESLWLKLCENSTDGHSSDEFTELESDQTVHENRIDGNSQVDGPSVQAGRINGGIHFHHNDHVRHSGSLSPGGPIMRVQREHETIEIYDEGLARIWITARLQEGGGK